MIDRFLTEKLPEIEFKSILGRGEYPLPKPDPAPYLKMVESAGILEAESVAIEDSSAGVRSATAAGIPVIQLDRYGAATEGVPSVRHAAQLVKWENLK